MGYDLLELRLGSGSWDHEAEEAVRRGRRGCLNGTAILSRIIGIDVGLNGETSQNLVICLDDCLQGGYTAYVG